MNRLTRVIDHNGLATVYEYDELGNRKAVRYPNGVVVSYKYDACCRLKEECLTDKSGKLLAKYSYTLGKAGERLAVREETEDKTLDVSYSYDSLNRLASEEISDGQNCIINDYTYDNVSNRLSKHTEVVGDVSDIAGVGIVAKSVVPGDTWYEYNELNQLIKETFTSENSENQETLYCYDANGNLIKTIGCKNSDYIYDSENRLISATVRDGNSLKTEYYTYDFNGNRLSKTTGNSTDTVYYINDISGSLTYLLAEVDPEGELLKSYVRGYELISAEQEVGKNSYYHHDGHGSVRMLTDSNGSITDSYMYDAYGVMISAEGTSDNEFLYSGEQYSYLTELYYLRARYVKPATGTFISADSYRGELSDPVTLHKYLYANANPVMMVDPSGYSSKSREGSLQGLAMTIVVAGILLAADMAQNNFIINGCMRLMNAMASGRPQVSSEIRAMEKSLEDYLEVFPAAEQRTQEIITWIPEAVLTNEILGEILYADRQEKALIEVFPQTDVEHALITVFPRMNIEESGISFIEGGRIYEKADYHGKVNKVKKNKAPNNGQEALDNSVPIGPNTTRRIGVSDGEIVVFDETIDGVFHGHVRSWDELTEPMKSALRKAGMTNKKGKIKQ